MSKLAVPILPTVNTPYGEHRRLFQSPPEKKRTGKRDGVYNFKSWILYALGQDGHETRNPQTAGQRIAT